MSEQIPNLGARVAKGAGWMISMRLTVRLIGFASTIVLARLLVPADFGLVALATVFASLLEAVAQFNFSVFLIKKQDTDRSYFDTAWTLTIIRGLLLALALAASARYTSRFFDRPELEAILYCLAGSVLIEGFANIGVVEFQKSLRFDREFRFLVYTKLSSFVVTLVLAFIMRSYWALVIGIISGRLAHMILSYVMHPFRPRFCLIRTGEVLSFSKWMLFNQILLFASTRADVFVIGKFVGAGPLGFYSVGQEIATLATSELVMPIRRALLPGYAKLSHDLPAIRQAYANGLSLILMLALPFAVGIALTAEPLVKLMLGDNWVDAVPLIQILAIAGILQILRANAQPLLLALNKPQLTTITAAAVTVSAIPLLLWWTPSMGTSGAAWAMTVSTAVGVIVNFLFVVYATKVRMNLVVAAVWRPLLSAAAMAAAVGAATERLSGSNGVSEAALLAIVVPLGAVVYVGTHLLFWHVCGKPHGSERLTLNAVQGMLSRRGNP